jgi:hypothetical protein
MLDLFEQTIPGEGLMQESRALRTRQAPQSLEFDLPAHHDNRQPRMAVFEKRNHVYAAQLRDVIVAELGVHEDVANHQVEGDFVAELKRALALLCAERPVPGCIEHQSRGFQHFGAIIDYENNCHTLTSRTNSLSIGRLAPRHYETKRK